MKLLLFIGIPAIIGAAAIVIVILKASAAASKKQEQQVTDILTLINANLELSKIEEKHNADLYQ